MNAVAHFDLTGKRAIVLGADTFAGTAVVAAFREAGADLAQLPAHSAHHADVEVERAALALDGVDILVCALDAFVARPFVEVSESDLDSAIENNFKFAFAAAQSAVRRMQSQRRGGNLVFVTHVLGSRGLPNSSAYCAAHGALANLIRALAQELAPAGISVNGIALGWMDWMTDRLDPTDAEAQRAIRFTLSKRAGRPNDVGPMAVWLAGSGVGYVSGQIFPLDGGLTQHL